MRKTSAKSTGLYCRIDVTALASVILALLAMFLFPAMVITHSRIGAELPKANRPNAMAGALKEDALLVVVQRDGRIFFGSKEILAEHLPAEIRQQLSGGAESKVYIRADARAKYRYVLPVLEAVRSAGVETVGFLVEQRGVQTR